MLKVVIAPEPVDFDARVRQPGLAWMAENGIDPNVHLPKGVDLKSFWKECLKDLRTAFGGWCCYTGQYLNIVDVVPVEHAWPKKYHPNLAYEWSNYRYAASRINSRKWIKDILDPAVLPKNTDVYHLELVTGSIFPNPALKASVPLLYQAAEETISNLSLDDSLYRDYRVEVWDDYLKSTKGLPEKDRLKKANKFVWYEASRQRLL